MAQHSPTTPQKQPSAKAKTQDAASETPKLLSQTQSTFDARPIDPHSITPAGVQQLQRSAGNIAVAHLLANQQSAPPKPVVQPKRKERAEDEQAEQATDASIQRTPQSSAPQRLLKVGADLSATPARIQRVKEKVTFQGQSKSVEKANKDQFKSTLTKMSTKNIKPAKGAERPKAVMLMGAYGAGKSSLLGEVVPDVSKFVHVDADQVKEAIPEYQAGLAKGEKDIATKVHQQSKDVAQGMAFNAINTRRNLLFDASGGDLGEYLMLIGIMRPQDYHITLAMTHISVDEGLKRIAERAVVSGRSIPDDKVRDVYKWVPKNFSQVVQKVDQAYLFDNMVQKGEAPRLIWETSDGTKLRSDQITYVEQLLAGISAKKVEDGSPVPGGGGDDSAKPTIESNGRYLQDGGTSRWMKDTGSTLSTRGTLAEIDKALQQYRLHKSKNHGNALGQGNLLRSLKTMTENSRYVTDSSKSTKNFMRRKKAVTLLHKEADVELRANATRVGKVASEAEMIKVLTNVGFTVAYLNSILKRDLRLLYEAHAALSLQQMDLAQAIFDKLNPVERDDSNNLKYSGNYVSRTRNNMHFAQQLLTSYHHTRIGGDYARTFDDSEGPSDERTQKITSKYTRNKDFMGATILNTVKNLGAGTKDLAGLISDNPHLTPEEIEAIRIYTSENFAKMNATMHDLRLDNPKDQVKRKGHLSVSEVATAALKKLPSYSGGYVYRGERSDFGGFYNTVRPGTVFQAPSFMSTTKNPSVTVTFGGTAGIVWIIKVGSKSRGKDIEALSTGQTEQEVLFPPGTKMRILDRIQRAQGYAFDESLTPEQDFQNKWKSDTGKPIQQAVRDILNGNPGLMYSQFVFAEEVG